MPRYEINLSCKPFQRNQKKLRKKFPHIKEDLKSIFEELEKKAPLGDAIPLMNSPVYKIRVKNSDIQRGKSGSYRLIYKFDKENNKVTPLIIYFKGDKETASISEINEALESLERDLFDEV